MAAGGIVGGGGYAGELVRQRIGGAEVSGYMGDHHRNVPGHLVQFAGEWMPLLREGVVVISHADDDAIGSDFMVGYALTEKVEQLGDRGRAGKLDVGAVAKGYIADRLRDYLEEEGIDHAMIDLGGNIIAMGSKLDGSDYNIGIQKPFDENGTPITSVKLSDKSIVTSGVYQRYFEQDGKIYHHILDPATGYPCENNLYSVTIITDSSLTADALSTTCFLLGYEKGMNLINQLNNVDAVFITNDNQIHYSKNFQHKQ